MNPTQQVPFAPESQTPAGVFGQCMQHMVQKAYSRPYPNVLRRRDLGGMSICILRRDQDLGDTIKLGVGLKKIERSTIKGKGELNLGFLSVPGNEGLANGMRRGRHYQPVQLRSDLQY